MGENVRYESDGESLRKAIERRDVCSLRRSLSKRSAGLGGLGLMSKAVFVGDLEIAKVLISFSCDLNEYGVDLAGLSPIHVAAVRGDADFFDWLLEAGADFKKKSAVGAGVLAYAARSKELKVLTRCLAGGADPNEADCLGTTAVHVAADEGWALGLTKLLEHGGKPDLKTNSGNFPLAQAALRGSADCMRALLSVGADATMSNARRHSVLSMAVMSGSKEAVKAALESHDFVSESSSGLPLIYASSNDRMVRFLLEAGFKPDVSSGKQSPLHAAAKAGNTKSVRCLLEAGAKVSVRDEFRSTPLRDAAGGGHWECMKVLLAAGADMEASLKDAYATLRLAAACGEWRECVALLLESGWSSDGLVEGLRADSADNAEEVACLLERFAVRNEIRGKVFGEKEVRSAKDARSKGSKI